MIAATPLPPCGADRPPDSIHYRCATEPRQRSRRTALPHESVSTGTKSSHINRLWRLACHGCADERPALPLRPAASQATPWRMGVAMPAAGNNSGGGTLGRPGCDLPGRRPVFRLRRHLVLGFRARRCRGHRGSRLGLVPVGRLVAHDRVGDRAGAGCAGVVLLVRGRCHGDSDYGRRDHRAAALHWPKLRVFLT